MIKNIFYALTIVASAAAAYFGSVTKGKLEARVSETVELVDGNLIVGKKIEDKEDDIKVATGEKKTAEEARDVTAASLENESSKESGLRTTLGGIEAEIEEADAELIKIDGAIATAEAIIRDILPDAGSNLEVDAVVGYIEDLENQRKEKQAELEEKTEVAGKLAKTVGAASAQKDRLQGRLGTVRNRIALNAVSATVTAVQTGYGFVVINRGADNSNIDEQSELLVSRNGTFVGRLKVSSVEPTQTICDIVQSSLKPGQRIQPGDRVTLKQAVPN